jgi:hypothetical protein
MLLRQFSVPVLIANAIAWPVAWYDLHGRLSAAIGPQRHF